MLLNNLLSLDPTHRPTHERYTSAGAAPGEPAPPGDPVPLSSHHPADICHILSVSASFMLIRLSVGGAHHRCRELGPNPSAYGCCAAQGLQQSALEPSGGTLLDVVVVASRLLTDLVWESECSSRSRHLRSPQRRRYARHRAA